jgi:CRP-like cAMP-binding protein
MQKQEKNVERLALNPDEVAKMLDKTNWGNDLDWDELVLMAKYIQAFKVRPHTVLFSEGEQNQTLAILVEGQVEIYKAGAENTRKAIAKVKSPQTFGEMSLIDGQPRSAEVVAATPSVCLLLTRDKFMLMADRQPKVAFKVLWKVSSLMSQRLRQTSGKLVDLS